MSLLSFCLSENAKIFPRCPLASECQSSDLHVKSGQMIRYMDNSSKVHIFTHSQFQHLHSNLLKYVVLILMLLRSISKVGFDYSDIMYVQCIYDVNI